MFEIIDDVKDGIIDGLNSIVDLPAIVLMTIAPVFFLISSWAGAVWVILMVAYLVEGVREDIQTILRRGMSYGIVYLGIQLWFSFYTG